MSKDTMKLNEDALSKVNGGMGQDVDSGAVRIVMLHCPKCCKNDDVTKFELNLKTGIATCTTCTDGNPTVICEVTEA